MQIWEPNATIRLYRVPWDSNYSDVVEFDSEAARDAWFASQPCYELPVNNSVYCYPNKPINVDVPYITAYTYNYVVVSNPERETSPTTPAQKFYYFITSCTQSAPQPTLLGLQQDVWTQYLYQSSFGVGYYEQGHLPMVNSPCLATDNIPATLSRYFAVDEGLSNGDTFIPYRYDTAYLQGDVVEHTPDQVIASISSDWLVIVSTADLSADPGNILSPKLTMAEGGVFGGVFSGSHIYTIPLYAPDAVQEWETVNICTVTDFFAALSTYSWVTQCIVSLTCVPSRLIEGLVDFDNPVQLLNLPKIPGTGGFSLIYTVKSSSKTSDDYQPLGTIDVSHVTGEGWTGVEQYQDLRKLWCYPYSAIELSNGKSTLVLKPQYLPANETEIRLMACAVSPFLEAAVVPWGYGCPNAGEFSVAYSTVGQDDNGVYTKETKVTSLPYGDLLDTALWFTEFPQWSVLNNNAVLYLAQNANTIRANYSAAATNLLTSSMSADVAIQNAQASYNTAIENAEASYNAEMTAAAFNLVGSAGGGAIGGIGKGTAGMVFGGTAGLVYGVTDLLGTDYTAGAAKANAQRSAQTTLENAGRNYDLANATNQLNYAQSIRSLEAGIADAQLVAPSSIGNVGGQGLRYINGLTYSVFIKYLRINPAYVAKLGDYFKRWGYKVNRYIDIPSDLRLCSPCTYWKFAEVYLDCAEADETAKNALRGIMLRGTTVWSSPDAIGNTKPTDVAPMQSRIATYYT